jgi:hypothetical protein
MNEDIRDWAAGKQRANGYTEVPAPPTAAGDVEAAVAALQTTLDVLKTNEPINRQEGDIEQADLEAKNAQQIENAIDALTTQVTVERIEGDLKHYGGFALTVNGVRKEFVGAEPEEFKDRASDYAAGTGTPMLEAMKVLAIKEGWDKREPMPGPAPVEPAAAPILPPVLPVDQARADDLALLSQIAAGQHPQMLEPELADLIEAALVRHPDDPAIQAEGERAIVAYSNGLMAATA